MIIRYRTTKAPKGQQTAGRGATPANGSVYKSPERAAGFFCHPFGVAFTPLTCRGCTPACGLISPSGFCGIFADNHFLFNFGLQNYCLLGYPLLCKM